MRRKFAGASARPVAALIAALVMCVGPSAFAPASAVPVQVPTAIASGDPFADLAGDSLLTVKEASERLESGGIGTMANTNVYCAILDGSFGCKTGYNNEDGLVVAAAYENRWFNSQNDGFVVIIFNPKYSVGCTSTTSDFEGGANFGSAYQDRVSSIKTFSGCDISLWSRRDLQFEGTSWIDSEDDLSPSGWNNQAQSFEIS